MSIVGTKFRTKSPSDPFVTAMNTITNLRVDTTGMESTEEFVSSEDEKDKINDGKEGKKKSTLLALFDQMTPRARIKEEKKDEKNLKLPILLRPLTPKFFEEKLRSPFTTMLQKISPNFHFPVEILL